MSRIKQFFTLTGLTAIEAIRQPICLLLTTTCVILTILVPILQLHNFGEEGKMVRDSGLALHFIFGLFIAGYAASSTLAKEIKRGTASAVLSKPVGRDLFFLAKFAGVACLILLFSACASIATLLSERIAEKFYTTPVFIGWAADNQTALMLMIAPAVAFLGAGIINYKMHRPFQSSAFALLLLSLLTVFFISGFFDVFGNPSSFDAHVQWRIMPASLLITVALIVLAAIAIMFSTRLSTVPTLTLCSVVFAIGLMSDYFFAAKENFLSAFLYYVIPNWQHFWVSDALSDGGSIPVKYIFYVVSYAALYLTGILCTGLISFRHAEIK